MSTDTPSSSNGGNAPAAGAGETDQPQQRLELQKIYLKDVSLETPSSPQIFTEQFRPQLNMEIQSNAKPLSEDVYEVVLNATITAKQGEQTGYLIEIQQAGVFTIKGFDKAQLGTVLGAFCPNTLFPYAREAIDALLVKGGFPPLQLAPINFDALYRQQQAKKNQDQNQGQTDTVNV